MGGASFLNFQSNLFLLFHLENGINKNLSLSINQKWCQLLWFIEFLTFDKVQGISWNELKSLNLKWHHYEWVKGDASISIKNPSKTRSKRLREDVAFFGYGFIKRIKRLSIYLFILIIIKKGLIEY